MPGPPSGRDPPGRGSGGGPGGRAAPSARGPGGRAGDSRPRGPSPPDPGRPPGPGHRAPGLRVEAAEGPRAWGCGGPAHPPVPASPCAGGEGRAPRRAGRAHRGPSARPPHHAPQRGVQMGSGRPPAGRSPTRGAPTLGRSRQPRPPPGEAGGGNQMAAGRGPGGETAGHTPAAVLWAPHPPALDAAPPSPLRPPAWQGASSPNYGAFSGTFSLETGSQGVGPPCPAPADPRAPWRREGHHLDPPGASSVSDRSPQPHQADPGLPPPSPQSCTRVFRHTHVRTHKHVHAYSRRQPPWLGDPWRGRGPGAPPAPGSVLPAPGDLGLLTAGAQPLPLGQRGPRACPHSLGSGRAVPSAPAPVSAAHTGPPGAALVVPPQGATDTDGDRNWRQSSRARPSPRTPLSGPARAAHPFRAWEAWRWRARHAACFWGLPTTAYPLPSPLWIWEPHRDGGWRPGWAARELVLTGVGPAGHQLPKEPGQIWGEQGRAEEGGATPAPPGLRASWSGFPVHTSTRTPGHPTAFRVDTGPGRSPPAQACPWAAVQCQGAVAGHQVASPAFPLNPARARSWTQVALDTCPLRGAFWAWESELPPSQGALSPEVPGTGPRGSRRDLGERLGHASCTYGCQAGHRAEGPTPARPDTCPAQDAPKTSRAGSTCLSTPCGGATCSRAGAAAPSPWHRPGHRWLCAWGQQGARHHYVGDRGRRASRPQMFCPHPSQGLAKGGAGRRGRGGCPQRAVASMGRVWDPIQAPGFSSQWARPAGSQPHLFEGQRGGPAPIFPTGSPPPCSVQPGLGQQLPRGQARGVWGAAWDAHEPPDQTRACPRGSGWSLLDQQKG